MKSGSHFWKLLKTIRLPELVFQSYSIQIYLWLCSSGKWLPERENSRDLYKSASIQLQRRMSFTLCRLANVLIESEILYALCSYSSEGTKSSVAAKSEQLPSAYSEKLSLRTALSSHKLFNYPDGPQKRNQPQAPKKPSRLPILNCIYIYTYIHIYIHTLRTLTSLWLERSGMA